MDDYYSIEIDIFNPKRAHVLFFMFLTFYNFFFGLYFGFEEFPFPTIAQLPFACLIYFGCYAMMNIGWHMMTLSDCKAAQDEILEAVKEARKDLANKGMYCD